MTSAQMARAWRAVPVVKRTVLFALVAGWLFGGSVLFASVLVMLSDGGEPTYNVRVLAGLLAGAVIVWLGYCHPHNVFLLLDVNPELLEVPAVAGKSVARADAARAFINTKTRKMT